MVLDLNHTDINMYNHLLCNKKEKKIIQETNPQKQALQTKIHKAYASHSHSTSRYGNTIYKYLNSYLTILTFNLFLCIIDFTEQHVSLRCDIPVVLVKLIKLIADAR